jgi:glycosyltransferase involved in cell wall biosynthesis
MKIAHFLGTMRPEHDGVTRVVYRLRELFDRDFAEHLFISPIGSQIPQDDIRTVPSIPFPLSTQYRLATVNQDSVQRVLGKDKPDIIHIHSPDPLGWAAMRYARHAGIPMVATYHTHFPSYAKYYHLEFLAPVGWQILRSLYSPSQVLIVPSQSTLEELHEHGIKNLIHIPHGVDTASFSPANRSEAWRSSILGDDPNRVIVSFVSRLVWEKNPMVLVNAWKHLNNKGRAKLVIVGDGPAKAKLEQLLPEAHFTGKLSGAPLFEAYASSDIFVFPSVTETFGNVTVEAMASGLPAICAIAGGARDIVIPGKNGLLFDADKPIELAQAIDELVIKPNLRLQMSIAALESVKRFRWDITVSAYERVYQNVAASKAVVPQLA